MSSWRAKLSTGAGVFALLFAAGPAAHAAQDSAKQAESPQAPAGSPQDMEQRLNALRTATWRVYVASEAMGTDARGRTLAQDVNEWVMSDTVRSRLRDLEAQGGAGDRPGGTPAAREAGDALLTEQLRRLSLIGTYWFGKPQMDRQRALWQRLREQVPNSDSAASAARVEPFEGRLRQDLSPTLSIADLQRDMLAVELAYNAERLQLAADVSARLAGEGGSLNARERRIPCLPMAFSGAPDRTGAASVGPSSAPSTGVSPPSANPGKFQGVRVLTSLPATQFYPTEARRAEISGRVILRLLIGVDGCVDQASIVRSSGAPELDQAAMDFSEYMRFRPAQKDGHAVASSVQMPVNFQLQGEPSSAVDASATPATGSLVQQSNAWQRQALAHYATGNVDQALSDSAAALRADPRAYGMDVLRARLLRFEHDPDKAVEQAEAALRAGPDDPDAYEAAAAIYASSNQTAKAMQALDHAVQIGHDEDPYLVRASWRRRSDLAGRRADIDAALARNPNSIAALEMRAELQSDAGAFTDAVSTLDGALRIQGDRFDLLTRRGVAYAKNHQDALAQKDFIAARALTISPGQLNDLCWTLATANVGLEEALDACDAAVRAAPGAGPILDSRAFVLLRLGRSQDSIAAYAAALQKNSMNQDSLYGRGLARLRSGQLEAGHQDIERALEIDATVARRFEGYGLTP